MIDMGEQVEVKDVTWEGSTNCAFWSNILLNGTRQYQRVDQNYSFPRILMSEENLEPFSFSSSLPYPGRGRVNLLFPLKNRFHFWNICVNEPIFCDVVYIAFAKLTPRCHTSTRRKFYKRSSWVVCCTDVKRGSRISWRQWIHDNAPLDNPPLDNRPLFFLSSFYSDNPPRHPSSLPRPGSKNCSG